MITIKVKYNHTNDNSFEELDSAIHALEKNTCLRISYEPDKSDYGMLEIYVETID